MANQYTRQAPAPKAKINSFMSDPSMNLMPDLPLWFLFTMIFVSIRFTDQAIGFARLVSYFVTETKPYSACM